VAWAGIWARRQAFGADFSGLAAACATAVARAE